MANRGNGSTGIIIVGIADNDSDAKKIRDLSNQNNVLFKNFHVTGIEHDLLFSNKTLEEYYNFIIDRIKLQPIESIYKNNILEHATVFIYRNKPMLKLSIKSLNEPAVFCKTFLHNIAKKKYTPLRLKFFSDYFGLDRAFLSRKLSPVKLKMCA